MAADDSRDLGIGPRVRQYRKLRNLSQQQLADVASVTPSFLSQLERGKSGASLATAVRLADALGVRFAHLFKSSDDDTTLLRHSELPELVLGEGHSKLLLSPPSNPHIEIYWTKLDPGHTSGEKPYSHGDADEFVIGTGGVLTVVVGDDEYRVGEGDVLHFRTSSLHLLKNESTELAAGIVIVTPPTEYDLSEH